MKNSSPTGRPIYLREYGLSNVPPAVFTDVRRRRQIGAFAVERFGITQKDLLKRGLDKNLSEWRVYLTACSN